MRTVEWDFGAVKMIDQRALPWKLEVVRLDTVEGVAESIRNMTVRGAPGDWRGRRLRYGARRHAERKRHH